GHLGPPLRAEEVGGQREVRAGDVGEQQGRTAGGDDPAVDLGGLEPGVHGRLDGDQVAVAPEPVEEGAEVRKVSGHGAGVYRARPAPEAGLCASIHRFSSGKESALAQESTPAAGPRHQPFVPETVSMPEYTLRAVLLGLVMTLVLGAANAYLGLRAGVTIAATYPAAVISMAFIRMRKGSILEENIARTAGSIGESVAAGAIFTLPAFVIAHAWPSFAPKDAYWKSTALMLVGGVLGVLFVSLVR